MKNKKFTLGLILLMAGSLFLTNCTKNKTNEAPVPDNNTESTQEVTKIQMIVCDIYDICGQVNDGASGLLPYLNYAPLSVMQGTNTINSVNHLPFVTFSSTPTYYREVTFNNTIGKDGRVRNGTLRFDYSPSTQITVEYNRHPGFVCDVIATGYSVDDYSVTVNSMRITNTTTLGFPNTPSVTPALYKLTWTSSSNISITRAVGSATETCSWVGTIDKTLLNTNNSAVPMATASPQTFTIYPGPGYGSLDWSKSYCSYSGNGGGTLADGTSYTLTYTDCTRNNNSSPQKFYSAVGTNMLVTPERHPFISGLMQFKPGSKPTRDIDFGVGEVVDYNAKVTIEGITYDVDCN